MGKGAKNPECTHPAYQNVNGTATLENDWADLQMVKPAVPDSPEILFIGIFSRKAKPQSHAKMCMLVFRIVTFICIIQQSPKVEQPKCSSVKELNNMVISVDVDMIHPPNRN